MLLLIICGVLGIKFLVLSIYFLTGRGWFLLAGYNTMPKDEKEKYDSKALCKFIGKITLIISLLSFVLGIESIVRWYIWVYIAAIVFLCVFAAVYSKTGNRFRK